MHGTSSIFQKNLALLRKINPQLSDTLQQTDSSTLPFAAGFPQEKNLVDTIIGPKEFIFPPHKAQEQIQNWWKEISPNLFDSIFVYGTGLGYPYEVAKSWLQEKPTRHLIFLEDDRRMLVRLLETPLATEMLESPQVRIHSFLFDFVEYGAFREMLSNLGWYYVMTKHILVALPYYLQKKPKRFALLQEYFQDTFNDKVCHFQLRVDQSRVHNENTCENLMHPQNVYLQAGLENCLKNIPAIICGAGPSLTKHLTLLKSLSSKAAIFSPGSSLFILDKQGIAPHINGVIDPGPPYRPYFLQTQLEIPTFIQNKASAEVVSVLHGKKVACFSKYFSEVEKFIEEKLAILPSTPLSGFTVGDFLTMVAVFLGCNPIILIGMDLAFTDNLYYSKEISGPDLKKMNIIQTKDTKGNTIYTKKDWLSSAKQLSLLAVGHPNQLFINATEGGIGFEDIVEIPFAETVEKYLKNSYDIAGLVHTALAQAHPFPASSIEPYLIDLKNNLLLCLDLVEKMSGELEHMALDFEKKTVKDLETFSERYLSCEKKLFEQPSYKPFLKDFWEFVSKFLQKKRDDIERSIDPKGSLWRLKKCEIDFYIATAKTYLAILQKYSSS